MPLDLFRLVVKQIGQLSHRVGTIHLYLHGESLMNGRLPEMVSLIKDQDVAEAIKLVTKSQTAHCSHRYCLTGFYAAA